jgi:hypothetical protein
LPDEITIIGLAEKYHQPFEYFLTLDYAFVKKLFIVLRAENKDD